MESDPRAHSNDKVAEDEGHHLHHVDGVCAKPEKTGHGTGEGETDQERIVDPLFERGTAR